MPTYEYQCNTCGHRFEAFHSITAEPLRECPACKGAVKRLVHGGVGLIFKGAGFYITDYKKDGNRKKTSSSEKTETTKKEKVEQSE